MAEHGRVRLAGIKHSWQVPLVFHGGNEAFFHFFHSFSAWSRIATSTFKYSQPPTFARNVEATNKEASCVSREIEHERMTAAKPQLRH
jgi:hypothetical protein